ncbi:hypothetical protein IFM89_030754 [Coptis chinensis]|uniref:Glutaredoxin domain-containing protein n=1 Tax=Coptis chinensis TaxID=261450 RepID=A0A835IXU9_9MAGN|nr:hypothetical protein IFM89_030754 [Coptis chinensis]
MAGLDEGLDHFDASPSLDKVKRSQLDKSKTSLVNGKMKKNYRDSYQSMKMNYFNISDVHEVPLENSTKPLWQHLSEELILVEMDSNVVSSFRKAELAKKMGFNHNKIMRSPVCEDKVMHLVDNKGGYLGRVEEVKQLHEDGELAKLVQDFPVQEPGFVCGNCGDARFVPCSSCSGSRKVFVEEDGQLTRCLDCNEKGLLRCRSSFLSARLLRSWQMQATFVV